MIARVCVWLALCVCVHVTGQQATIYVDVSGDVEEVEKRYTPELVKELRSVESDALLLYTEYTSQCAADLHALVRNISNFTEDTKKTFNKSIYDTAPERCQKEFLKRLKKIEYDVHRAASFSAENHHKYFLGHMVVFRIHLNKSQEYVSRCEKVYKSCGLPCETTPRQMRWRRYALNEMDRVKDDIIHSRRSYKDLLMHSKRRLNHFHKQAQDRAKMAIHQLQVCSKSN